MRLFVLLCGLLMLCGCGDAFISKAQLSDLNGYWEIAEVTFPDGTQKQYTLSPSIDFIHLKDGKGFRKKMQPKLDGTYDTSRDVALLAVKSVQDTFTLQYKNDFSRWEETLVRLDAEAFSVLNAEGVLYSYKRFNPIVIPK